MIVMQNLENTVSQVFPEKFAQTKIQFPAGAGASDPGSKPSHRHARTRFTAGPGVMVAALVVLLLAGVYFLGGKDHGLVTQAVVTGLLLGGVYALVSIGLTLIFGVLGIVNFAQGAMLTLAMYLVYVLSASVGLPVYVSTLLAVPIMFLLGMAVQHLLLTKLTISGSHEGPLLVTLGLSLLIGNGLLMAFGGRPKTVGTPFAGSVQVLGAVVSYSRLLAFVGAVVVALALTLVLRRTSLGLSIRAVAANSRGAQLVGVNVNRIYALTFGIGSGCVAVAGGLITPFTQPDPIGRRAVHHPGVRHRRARRARQRRRSDGRWPGGRAGADRRRALPARAPARSSSSSVSSSWSCSFAPRASTEDAHDAPPPRSRRRTRSAPTTPALKDGWLVRQLVALAVGLVVLAVLPLVAQRPQRDGRRAHADLRDHGRRLEPDERLRRHVQLRPRRVLRHRRLHRRLPARRARCLAVDLAGRWLAVLAAVVGMLIAYLCLRYRLAGAYFALATFAFAQMFLLLVQNLDALNKTEGFNIADPALGLVGQDAVPAGQSQLLLDPAGDPGGRRAGHHPVRPLALRPVRAGGAGRRDGGGVAGHQRDASPAPHRRAQLRHHLDGRRLLHAVLPLRRARTRPSAPRSRSRRSSRRSSAGSARSGARSSARRSSVRSPRSSPSLLRNPPPFLDFLQGTAGLDVTLYAVILIAIVLFLPKGVFGSIRDRWRR